MNTMGSEIPSYPMIVELETVTKRIELNKIKGKGKGNGDERGITDTWYEDERKVKYTRVKKDERIEKLFKLLKQYGEG